ncbi:MAG: KpsF/GutQ family sugar-phosphate isomerase [Betaproteobacteria bacterium]|nr:KpsF/GutQ family sugar-phosphate isomerase [Betaproteobacteria bacterium]
MTNSPGAPAAPSAPDETDGTLRLAREVLEIEAAAVRAMATRLDGSFVAAHDLILAVTDAGGRVVVTGMGKSGHIGNKIAATLASTGTPAFFMHPAEASHGDLGMITGADAVIAISYSGESDEILRIYPALKRRGTRIIALTGKPASSMAKDADVHLDCAVEKEACPLELAPTSSSTATLALGDALAMALLNSRGFTSEDFASHHPAGALGRRLLVHVRDVMRQGDELPKVAAGASLTEAIFEMSKKGMGMTAIVDHDGRILGMFTDGDLRRTWEKHDNLKSLKVADVMTRSPRTIGPDKLATEAVHVMQSHHVSGRLLVTRADGTLVGALTFNDLLKAGVV